MSDIREKIKKESQLFAEALPKLLKTTLKGRWVVFRDGAVQGDYATESEAYKDAVRRFSLEGGFAIHEVKEQEPIFITAGAVYGVRIGC